MPQPHASSAPYTAREPVTLGEILSALSVALDITEGARPGHAIRTCMLGMQLGGELGLSAPAMADLYYALLLKDIGCSANASRMAEAFDADDQTVKQQFKLMDREKLGKPNREALTFVWENVAPEADVWSRVRQVYRMVSSRGDLTAEVIGARCERGAAILHKLGMPIDTCAAVYTLDEHWNGHGLPDRLAGDQIPLAGRICSAAQYLDLFCQEYGPARALDTLRERANAWYDPEVVRAAESLQQRGALWTHCLPGDDQNEVRSAVVALDPGSSLALAERDIDLICSGFADVVDAKSPFTFRHSVATTEAATLISRAMDLPLESTGMVRRAALLHDIGMLSVPNTLLDKPEPLSSEEWATVHRHPLVGKQLLSSVGAFRDVATLVSQHHERLDGSGYPHRLKGSELAIEARILAVADVLSAMMASRPYREDLHPGEVQRQLAQETAARLDPAVVDAALSVLDELAVLPLEDIPAIDLSAVPDLLLVEPPPFRLTPA